MATAQINSSSTNPTVFQRPHVKVEFRAAWSGTWTTFDYVRAESCSRAAAPTMSRLQLIWLSGKIKHEDQNIFQIEQPKDLKDWYARVSVIPTSDQQPGAGTPQGGPNGQPQPVILGYYYIPEESLRFGGDARAPLGDQSIVAYGLEYLLDRKSITTAWVCNDDTVMSPTAQEISVVPMMNEKFERGSAEIGNRSNVQITTDLNAGQTDRSGAGLPTRNAKAYVFSDSGKAWTVKDFVEYLLAYHGDAEVTFSLGGQIEALNFILPKFDFAGMTVYEALNRLIDRRRGLGWCVRDSEDQLGPDNQTAPANGRTVHLEVHVFTTTDTAIVAGDLNLPANAELVTLDLSSDHRIGDVVLTVDTQSRYGKIIITGEPILVMFSVSVQDENLEPAWTTAEQTKYKAGSGDGSDQTKNDAERATDKFQHVFTTMRIPRTWDWKAGGGAGSSTGAKNIVNIGTDDNANVTSFEKLIPKPYRNWGRRLAEKLPLLKDSSDPTYDGQREYRDPFVILAKSDGTYVYADRASVDGTHPALNFRMLDKTMGFELGVKPNHLLALNHWDGAKGAYITPDSTNGFDYEKMIATVAVRTDARAQVVISLPYQTYAGKDPAVAQAKTARLQNRVLQVNVAGAELWFCVPNTVIDVTDGKPVRRAENNLQAVPQLSCVLRDDSARLRAVGALAKQWYSKARSAVTLTINEFEAAYPVGSFAQAAQDLWRYEPINAPVTEKIYNFGPNLSTEIKTNFAELDPTVVDREGSMQQRHEEKALFRNPRE